MPTPARYSAMGLMSKLFGGEQHHADDYVELETDDFDVGASAADTTVYFATLSDEQDVIAIKDAVYDGDMVIVDIIRHTTNDRTMERIRDQLRQVADEVGGDIVQKDDDQLVVTPSGVRVAREKLRE